MKKLILILLVIGFMYPKSLMVCTYSKLRDKMPYSKSKVIQKIMPGDVYEIVDTYSDWYFVEITGNSIHKGKKGWMWSERVKSGLVIIEGCSLRSQPKYDYNNKDKHRIAKIRVGASVKILKKRIVFYQIKHGNFYFWIWKNNIKIMN